MTQPTNRGVAEGGQRSRGVVVVNEKAPRARGTDWHKALAHHFGQEIDLEEVRVRDFAHAHRAARFAAGTGAQFVIAVGGDGTVNACANGIGNASTRLAVMPAGTANDLARLLGQDQQATRDPSAIVGWQGREIDSISINQTRFFSAGGVGFVADAAATANRWRSHGPARWLFARIGSFIYTLACLVVIFFRRHLGATFRIAYVDSVDGRGREVELDGYGVLVANCDRLGRSFHLSPSSRIDDGIFELILFPRSSRRNLFKTVLYARAGRLFEIPGVRLLSVTRARITTDADLDFFGDGETLERGRDFELGIAGARTRLMTPVVAESVAAEDRAYGSAVG